MYSIPILNQDHLNRQRKQIMNNAYSQLQYIHLFCKPFLKSLREGDMIPLYTDHNFKFVETVPKEDIKLFGHDHYVIVPLKNKGRRVIFPAGEYKYIWLEDAKEIHKEQVVAYDGLLHVNESLQDAITKEHDCILLCEKFYTIETNMYKSVERVLSELKLDIQNKPK